MCVFSKAVTISLFLFFPNKIKSECIAKAATIFLFLFFLTGGYVNLYLLEDRKYCFSCLKFNRKDCKNRNFLFSSGYI